MNIHCRVEVKGQVFEKTIVRTHVPNNNDIVIFEDIQDQIFLQVSGYGGSHIWSWDRYSGESVTITFSPCDKLPDKLPASVLISKLESSGWTKTLDKKNELRRGETTIPATDHSQCEGPFYTDAYLPGHAKIEIRPASKDMAMIVQNIEPDSQSALKGRIIIPVKFCPFCGQDY